MNYTAPENDDVLRIVVDRPNMVMRIYHDSTDKEPFGKSFGANSGEMQIMIAMNLKP